MAKPERGESSVPLRVLFMGNSQIHWCCDVPQIVGGLSRSAPARVRRVESVQIVIGGADLERLWTDGRPRTTIAAGGWDWVVCNELIYSYGGNTAKFQEYARLFHQECRKSGARMVFFATGEIESAKLSPGAMYQDCLAMARECGGRVAGGGMAWLKAWDERPALDLHHADRAHPNEMGYYLNACVIYAALTDSTPVGLDPFVLAPADAAFAQGIAWRQYEEDRRNEGSPG